MTAARPRIALCFFGITRSLKCTHASIKRNVIAPLQAAGDVQIFGHFFRQTEIANPRSGEFGTLSQDDHALLPFDGLDFDDPNCEEVTKLFDAVRPFGVAWKGDESSLRNLCHQLTSLDKVTEMSRGFAPDITVFCRPDLLYHDHLGDVIARVVAAEGDHVFLPYWQASGGLNDRFALIRGEAAARAYGQRGRSAVAYCQARQEPLASERLVGFVLSDHRVDEIPHRATRIRFDGSRQREEFDTRQTTQWRQLAKRKIGQPGLRSLSIKVIRAVQALTVGSPYRGLDEDWLDAGEARP